MDKNTTRLVSVSAIFVIIAALATIFQDEIKEQKDKREMIQKQKNEDKKRREEIYRIMDTPIMDYRQCNYIKENDFAFKTLSSDFMEKCQKRMRTLNKKCNYDTNCYLEELKDLIKE